MTAPSVSVGVYLGSDSCVIATSAQPGRQEIVADDMGERSTPICVTYTAEETLVAASAKNAYVRHPRNTVHALLPLLSAASCSDVSAYKLTCEVDDASEDGSQPGVVLPTVDAAADDEADALRRPNEVFCAFAEQLKMLVANAAGNTTVGTLVVAVPRGTDCSAVLQVLRHCKVVPAATTVRVVPDDAAAVCLATPDAVRPLAADAVSPTRGAPPQLPSGAPIRNVLVLHWGAFTARASVMSVDGGVVSCLADTSRTGTGGRALDRALSNQIADGFMRKTRADPREEPRSMRKLYLAAERAKLALSVAPNASVEIEAFCNGVDLAEPVSRMKHDMAFDSLGAPALLQQLVQDVVGKASVTVDAVVTTGGMFRVPRAAAVVKNVVSAAVPSAMLMDLGATNELAALGACIAAQSLTAGGASWVEGDIDSACAPRDVVLRDKDGDAVIIIPAGSPLPAERRLPTGGAAVDVVVGYGKTDDAPVQWLGVVTTKADVAAVDIVVNTTGDVAVYAAPDGASPRPKKAMPLKQFQCDE